MRTSSARRSGAHLHVRTGGLVRAFRVHAWSTKRTIGANHLAGTLRQLTLRPTVPLGPPEVRSSRAHPNPNSCGIPQSGGQSRAAIQPGARALKLQRLNAGRWRRKGYAPHSGRVLLIMRHFIYTRLNSHIPFYQLPKISVLPQP